MEDIVVTVPRSFVKNDGSIGWENQHYWTYEDGTYTVCDDAGDHAPVEEDEVPDADEERGLWREYAEWVAQTGEDPLGNYLLPRTLKRSQRWVFRLRQCIGHVRVLSARTGSTRLNAGLSLSNLPAPVREYLRLQPGGVIEGLASLTELADKRTGEPKDRFLATAWSKDGLELTVVDQITWEVPRSPAAVARDLKRAARTDLKGA